MPGIDLAIASRFVLAERVYRAAVRSDEGANALVVDDYLAAEVALKEAARAAVACAEVEEEPSEPRSTVRAHHRDAWRPLKDALVAMDARSDI